MNSAGKTLPPPSNREIEVTLFGPGFGESILLHLGNNQWCIIDSCRNEEGNCAPLEYLNSMNVPKENIQLVIISHWHDDHIRGITNVLREYKEAKVFCSAILQKREIVGLIKVQRNNPLISGKGVEEINNALEICKEAKRILPTFENRCLLNSKIGSTLLPFDTVIHSISPSAEGVRMAQEELVDFYTKSDNTAVPDFPPNLASVAIYVEIGNEKLVFGADLENPSDVNIGWRAVLKNHTVLGGKSGFFKVSHHGSINGFSDDFWNKFLVDNVFCGLTPFNKAKTPLPTKEGIKKIKERTKNCYITSNPGQARYKIRDHHTRMTFDKLEFGIKNIAKLGYSSGRITFRKKMDTNEEYQVHCFGSASELQ